METYSYSKEMRSWMSAASNQLVNEWGLDKTFANKVSEMLLWFFYNNLSPVITSGYRSNEEQKRLQALWDSGNRAGLRARPVTGSQHSTTRSGKPSSRAIDITTNNEYVAAEVAKILGIVPGYYFKNKDPGHYQLTT